MTRLFLFVAFMLCTFSPQSSFAEEKESVYDRVMRTGTIRCGYGIGAPLVSVDANTGKLSGIMVEVMDEIGKSLSLKIEWAEEVGWGELATALQSRRVDAICSTMWASGGRGRYIAYTRPLFFSKIDVYARIDETRFKEPDDINQSNVRIVVTDNDISEEIADADFPEAQKISKPQLTGEQFIFLELINNKADIAFTHATYAHDFMLKNPDKIRRIPLKEPLRLYDNVLGVDIHEQELRDMLNAGLGEIINAKKIEKILAKYEAKYPDMLLQVAKPYAVPE